MAEKVFEAKTELLDDVLEFVGQELEQYDCPMKVDIQLKVAIEELFVNIAHYAYGDATGEATIQTETEPGRISVTFIDSGTPYDPLAKEDPDITLSVEDRPIGGLGIYMVKKSMDSVEYEYKDGKNQLTIVKTW